GGVPVPAPTLREVELGEDSDALDFARELASGAFEAIVLMTGVGTRALAKSAEPVLHRAALAAALGRVTVIARGPKPVQALKELGAPAPILVPAPNTHDQVLAELRARGLVRSGARVALVEHGRPTPELEAPLVAAGVELRRVRVYRWALVDDPAPLLS